MFDFEIEVKNSHVCGQVYWFQSKTIIQRDISPQLMPRYWVLVAQTKILEVREVLECKMIKIHYQFWGVGLGGLSRVGVDKKSGKEAATFPDFKINIYDKVSKTFNAGNFYLANIS